jgi:hypothetical protein
MDEPRDVKVARVLGLTVEFQLDWSRPFWTFWEAHEDMASKGVWMPIPEYASDPAWVVRMIEANRPSIEDDDGTWFVCSWQRCCGGGCDSDGDNLVQGTGKTLGKAVVSWVLAAAEAGVEVKQ